jgi:hypothetical protein
MKRIFPLLFLLFLIVGLTAVPDQPVSATNHLPPERATHYGGDADVRFPHRSEFSIGGALTIEAWVYREDDSACETILSNDYTENYWLGFCPNLRFYSGGGGFADATIPVPAGQWTHVAASYNGSSVTFFVDGQVAGNSALSPNTSPVARTLFLGADPNAGGLFPAYHFSGGLDEVRLWSVARSTSEIQSNRNRELRSGTGLVAVFENGGDYEALAGETGSSNGTISTSPWGILPRDRVAPEAALSPNVDGNVSLVGEYAGAEQMVIPLQNGDVMADATAYLVYDNLGVYIGVRFPQPSTNIDFNNTELAIMLDADHSQDHLAQSDDRRLTIPFDGNQPSWWVGTGSGGWSSASAPHSSYWTVDGASCVSEFAPSCREIYLSWNLLGSSSDIDGLALGMLDLSLGSGYEDYPAPADAVLDEPDSWASLSYGGESAALPRAYFQGSVRDVALGANDPVEDHTVSLWYGSTLLYTDQTTSDGNFVFSGRVPEGAPLTLQVSSCFSTGCQHEDPVVSPHNTQPDTVRTTEVVFPACSSDPCYYASVHFPMWLPDSVGQVEFDSYDRDNAAPAVQVRRNPDLYSDPTKVTIYGSNIHPFSPIYLYEDDYRCNTRPPLADCEKVEATVHEISPDGTEAVVSVPQPVDFGRYFFGMHDTWARPANGPLSPNSYRYGPDISMVEPEYPYLWGLGFENVDDDVEMEEFLGVYGKNAYFCPGFWDGDVCYAVTPVPVPVPPVPEPRYFAIWYGVYAIWIGTGNGSCNGMAATSLLMHDGVLESSDLSSSVYYPAGFTETGKPADYIYTTPLGPMGAPPYPVDLWAHVRVNHGVQVSSEFMVPSIATVAMGPSAVTDSIRSDPTNFVLCVRNGGSGHCVSPFRVRDLPGGDSAIDIYDNNYPNEVRTITIDRSADRFLFPFTDTNIWDATWMSAVPLSVWQNERSAFDDLTGVISTMVFGNAETVYSTSEGEWGWKDGSLVETMPGAFTMPMLDQDPDWNPHTPVLFLPSGGEAPQATVNSLGGPYNFFAAGDGNLFNLQMLNSTAGNEDGLHLGYNSAGTVDGFRFTPEQATGDALPRLSMQLGGGSSTVFTWKGLSLPGGAATGYQALPELDAAVFSNDTPEDLGYELIVQHVDAGTGTVINLSFDELLLPALSDHRLSLTAEGSLLVELDGNGDGTYESQTVREGRGCAPQDLDGDGFAETCADASVFAPNQMMLPVIGRP